ncbi:SNF2 family N-terminal domain-containing protein [Crucibulum laeve]|uniref:SNF2 family N-terminal domain-containing protein n=1 Tax=Crucibulum laeve TaxID=68775 RepID=A0A5C3LIM3_9AGAR|nr:SNF2 family N-terminal domain-containing protein [Crucibulum laeve]
MRDTVSNHTESIRVKPAEIWSHLPIGRENFRPALNLRQLSALIQISTGNDAPQPLETPDKGKKRSASPTPLGSRKSKRTKFLVAQGKKSIVDELECENSQGKEMHYPYVERPELKSLKNNENVPILRHVLEIQYTNTTPSAEANENEGENNRDDWELEEQSFLDMLDELRDSLTEPKTLDLGDIRFLACDGRVIGASETLKKHDKRYSWLFLTPALSDDFNLETADMSSPTSQDWLMACSILETAQKASVEAQLKMVFLPAGFYDEEQHELPFRLQIECDICLTVPSIFEPLSPKETRKRSLEVEDASRRLLRLTYGSETPAPESFEGLTNISYFYSILGPAPSLPSKLAEEAMQPDALLPNLLPFQRRSVAWLLEREGKTVTPQGELVSRAASDEFLFWSKVEEGNNTWYYNRLSGLLFPEVPSQSTALGGILAEEPGLGKTLETIALILLNPAPVDRNPSLKRWDPETRLDVRAIKTTLIVTPSTLSSQWIDEIAAHAPSLKVLVYEGWAKVKVPITQSQLEEERLSELKVNSKGKGKGKAKAATKNPKRTTKKVEDTMDVDEEDLTKGPDGKLLDWCAYVHQFDIVITTYAILRTDFNVARAAPVRPRREDVVYANVERPRSPLVMVEWNRVIMDEVQMVGGGKTEDMVSLIPRLSSFAVSGTPSRAQISDLMHVLKFLRVDDIIGSARLWNRLMKPTFAGDFAQFFQKYAIRTMKKSVKDELTIPLQTRFLVPIELGKVERHVYDQTLEVILLDLGLDARGVAASSGWQVDGALLRSSLRRLRGICTHPQVGQLQHRGDNLYKPGALKTMDAVLETMRDQNWRNVMEDWKAKIQSLIRYAQLQQHERNNLSRYENALETLICAETETNRHIEEIMTVLSEHDAKGEILKKKAAALKGYMSTDEAEASSLSHEKGKGRQTPEEIIHEDDPEDQDLPRNPTGEEHKNKRRALKQRLREARLLLHRVKFLQGDVYHVLGGDHSESEDAAYEAAETIRRGLLKASEDEAIHAMTMLSEDSTSKRFDKDDLVIDIPFFGRGGIRSSELMEEVNEIIENVLNSQSQLLWQWRTRITELLTSKLNPGEAEADGQEYQRTLDNQGEAETFLQAYTALLADRRETLVNERTLLAAHDVREKKLRHTKAAIKAAHALEDAQLEIPDDLEMQPEHEVMHLELSTQRKDILQRLQGRAVKSVLVDLNAVGTRIYSDNDPEKTLIKETVAKLRTFIAEQITLHDKLDLDLALIRKAFNQRILYFRQLQEISDSVAEVEWELGLMEALEECVQERREIDAKINTNRARHRYLDNLAKSKDDAILDDDEETCILCRCDFARGFITQCAHVFCEGCMKAWLLRKEGKSCPVCRVVIDPTNIQRFAVDTPDIEPPLQPLNGEPAPHSRRQISYNKIDPKLFREIEVMESFGDFGSKIQTLIRHLLYLQLNDPQAKSIVFSAWADSLRIVEWALNENGIRCLRIDQNSKGESATKKFRTDPEILVLLLHGERENVGLNVTCASRVFLLESVVHHSFEVQAIARIDRMGQTRATEVYCYYAEDTVERNILDLAARQGLSLYTKENAAGSLNVSSFVADTEKKTVDAPLKKVQKGDFIFKIDDMLAILFPHMYEDLDYLLPLEDVVMQDISNDKTRTTAISNQAGSNKDNAIAGPSRIRL